jgi:uncharacterized protein
MTDKSMKVVFDTNIWISFLIGKRLSFIKEFISSGHITVVTTQQLLDEISEVAGREKMRKYFPQQGVTELLEFLSIIAENITVEPTYFINRDPKDNFLLDLIHFSKADYLVTGDKDLLAQDPFETARIVTPTDFEWLVNSSQ